MKKLVLIVVLVALVAALAGCSAPDNASVTITDTGYSPAKVTVKAGGSVTWTNSGKIAHTVSTSDFDSAAVYPGQRYTTKFDKPGTVTYYCRFHPAEKAEVVVK